MLTGTLPLEVKHLVATGSCSCPWIVKKKRGIELPGTYADDSFGPELTNNVTWYTPYCKFMPANQVKLLQLWDEINLPHKESKQIFRSLLTIIRFKVNADALSMTMPPDKLSQLITAIHEFTTSKHKFTLCEWQRLTGWINGSLNVFLLLRPALHNFYVKISRKSCTLPFPTDSRWTPDGLHLEKTSSYNFAESPSGLHMDSIWNPPGIQVSSRWS